MGMRDFYAASEPMPLDQADGLRRMFAGARPRRFVPLVANPHVAFAGVVIERLTAAFGAAGRHTLVVDAADNAPAAPELARVDLASAIEPLGSDVSYLAARGLPLAYVDTRGSASALLDALGDAAPQADVVLVHASASDLARVFQRRPARPVVVGADHPESIKHAYAAVKLLAQRCTLMTFDLLLAADPASPRLPHIAASLSGCADGFLGCVLHQWAVIDPASALHAAPPAAVQRLVEAQLSLDAEARAHALPPASRHERSARI
jgi:flagellar biosynthesis protein FlhG